MAISRLVASLVLVKTNFREELKKMDPERRDKYRAIIHEITCEVDRHINLCLEYLLNWKKGNLELISNNLTCAVEAHVRYRPRVRNQSQAEWNQNQFKILVLQDIFHFERNLKEDESYREYLNEVLSKSFARDIVRNMLETHDPENPLLKEYPEKKSKKSHYSMFQDEPYMPHVERNYKALSGCVIL